MPRSRASRGRDAGGRRGAGEARGSPVLPPSRAAPGAATDGGLPHCAPLQILAPLCKAVGAPAERLVHIAIAARCKGPLIVSAQRIGGDGDDGNMLSKPRLALMRRVTIYPSSPWAWISTQSGPASRLRQSKPSRLSRCLDQLRSAGHQQVPQVWRLSSWSSTTRMRLLMMLLLADWPAPEC